MPNIRLSKRTIDAIGPPERGQVLYRDTDLSGFGLRVGTKTKVFFVESQVRRLTVRATIGPYGDWTPEAARKQAMTLLSEMANGNDLNRQAKKVAGADLTLRDAFDEFFDRRALSSSSKPNYERTIDLYLKGWAKLPIIDISRRMVLDMHKTISETNGKYTANNVMRHFRSVYNFTSATHDDLPPNPVMILSQARAWNKERRRRSVIPAHGLPNWWRAVH